MTIQEKILIEYRRKQRLTIAQANTVTCHLLAIIGEDEDAIVDSCGTGVFLQIENSHFLITAAHVAEDLNYQLSVGIDEHTIHTIGGQLITNNPGISRSLDKLDICILKISEESVERISSHYSFLDSNDLGINHEFKPMPMYELLGYPATKSKFNKFLNRLISRSYQYITMPAIDVTYSDYGCTEWQNVILCYNRKKVKNYSTGQHQIGPKLSGISGCGLWYTPPNALSANTTTTKLVAIITEWPDKFNRTVLISTRIDVVTEIIRQRFDFNIEKSKILSINIEFD
jgi:hypothetical protein